MRIRPIGFFDSGAGGLSVLKEAVKIMPEENYLYFGDTANAPYGEKSKEEIITLTTRCVQKMLNKDIKALVVACNTATSVAVEILRNTLKIPVISMEPAIKPALENTANGNILVMATPATLSSERVLSLIEKYDTRHRVVPLPCSNLAYLVEKNVFGDSALDEYLTVTLTPYKNADISAVVLGCTHYIFIKNKIAAFFPPETAFFDGNLGTVLQLKRTLEKLDLKLPPMGTTGTIEINSSNDDQHTMKLYRKLLY